MIAVLLPTFEQQVETMVRKPAEPLSFGDMMAAERARVEIQLTRTPKGPRRDLLVCRLRQLAASERISKWAASLALQPPK
jgi:hypothetical protein